MEKKKVRKRRNGKFYGRSIILLTAEVAIALQPEVEVVTIYWQDPEVAIVRQPKVVTIYWQGPEVAIVHQPGVRIVCRPEGIHIPKETHRIKGAHRPKGTHSRKRFHRPRETHQLKGTHTRPKRIYVLNMIPVQFKNVPKTPNTIRLPISNMFKLYFNYLLVPLNYAHGEIT